jgi:two-component system response regulator YesN
MERYIRIDRAKELLDFTDKSIAEIAEASGFSNQNYFTRTFKKITGMTPSHYRKTGEHKNSFLPD